MAFNKYEIGLNNRTPAEPYGIKLDGDRNWETLIQNATISEINQDDAWAKEEGSQT
jgi:hypothetical protein